MPVAVVITCKKCDYKTAIEPIVRTDIFGQIQSWQSANPKRCRGCKYDHSLRISVKEVRPQRLPKRIHAETPRGRQGKSAKVRDK